MQYLLGVERSWMGERLSDDAKLRELGARVIAWYDESILRWIDRADEFG